MKKYFLFIVCFTKIMGTQMFYSQEREEIAALDVLSYGQNEQDLLVWRDDETGQERRDERLRQQEQDTWKNSGLPH